MQRAEVLRARRSRPGRRLPGPRLGTPEPAARQRVDEGQRRDVGEHVGGLRVRDRRDEGEGDEAVEPPAGMAQRGQRGAGEAREVDALRHEPADRVRPAVPTAVHRDAQALEREAGDHEVQQPADEHPVADPVPAPVVLRVAGVTVRAGVVELARLEQRAADHHREQPRQKGDAEEVQRQRVAQVEVAREEPPAEEPLGDVGVDREDHRADEEHHEAVEDPAVGPPGVRVAASDHRLAGDPPSCVPEPPRPLPDGRQRSAAPAAVLHGRADDPVGEHEHRQDGQDVEQRLQARRHVPEDLPRRLLPAGHAAERRSIASARSKRSTVVP